jgi:hypothetical protein
VNITGNTTVYAVWGYDLNGNGIPDVNETKYTLMYNVNGGNNNGPAPETVVAQNNYVLNSTVKPTHAADATGAIVFIGWSLAQLTYVFGGGDTLPIGLVTTTVNITSNTTVYAVWGYDLNNNGIPDIFENNNTYTLTYNVNGGNNNGPAAVTGLVAQSNYALNTTVIPTHAPDSTGSIVFLGWSLAKISYIFSPTDTLPLGLLNTTVNINSDTTVYAVWGYEANNVPGGFTIVKYLNGVAAAGFEFVVYGAIDTNGNPVGQPLASLVSDKQGRVIFSGTQFVPGQTYYVFEKMTPEQEELYAAEEPYVVVVASGGTYTIYCFYNNSIFLGSAVVRS